MIRFRRTSAGVAAVALGALGLVAAASPAEAAPTAPAAAGTAAAHSRLTPAADLSAARKRAAAYWTPARMRAAKEMPAPAGTTSTSRTAQAAAPHGAAGRANPATPDPVAARASLALGTPSAGAGGTATTFALSQGQQWVGGLPSTAFGRAFFTDDLGGNYSCTAESLASDSGNALLTAGHCVVNASNGHWYNWNYQTNTWGNWIFVPGYRDGVAPYGLWYAYQLWTASAYLSTQGDGRYDMAAVVMNTNAYGYHLQDVVGSEGMEWNYPLVQDDTVFGYPGTGSPEFNAERLIYCQGTTYSDAWGREQINCNQGHGASGGAWLDDFDGNYGWANSVVSTGTELTPYGTVTTDIGPYFGDAAYSLWSSVRYL